MLHRSPGSGGRSEKTRRNQGDGIYGKAAKDEGHKIFAIGNAPTALIALYEMVKREP